MRIRMVQSVGIEDLVSIEIQFDLDLFIDKIFETIVAFEEQRYRPDHLLISEDLWYHIGPLFMHQLFKRFFHAFHNPELAMKQIFGLEIIKLSAIPKWTVILTDSKAFGDEAVKTIRAWSFAKVVQ